MKTLAQAFELVERVIGGEPVRMAAMATMGAEMVGNGKSKRRGQSQQEKEFNQMIGLRMEALRRGNKIKQVDMARMLGVLPCQLYAYEAGYARCSVYLLNIFAQRVNVNLDDLIT
jgi:DNA-binding transcriptional regulator YiaG